jgi:RNA polymerase sigma factor (TIGR02999 family)
MTTVTDLLAKWQEGPEIHSRVMPLVYADLRHLAGCLFSRERPDHTLQVTGLINEAYIRIANGGPFESHKHFFGAAANAMRQTLVDYARRRNAGKRWGSFERVALGDVIDAVQQECCEILTMDQLLRELEVRNPRQAELVKLRYFTGLTLREATQVLGVSLSTAKDDWSRAKEWLKEHLEM